MPNLASRWVRFARGRDKAVVTECLIAWVVVVIATTIAIESNARLRIFPSQSLINKVPDKATLICRILANQIPILFKTTHRVTHCMRVLALNKWACWVTIKILFALLIRCVHRTLNIRVVVLRNILVRHMARLLILYWASLVITLYPIIASVEVRSIACLITQTPDNYRWVVIVTQHNTLITCKMCCFVILSMRKALISISHTVRLNISLINNINTILIAQVIPQRRVRIVASTHGVKVMLLHNLNITKHILICKSISALWVHLVTICTLNKNGLTIYKKLIVPNLNTPKADIKCCSLSRGCYSKFIEIWCLRAPSINILNLYNSTCLASLGCKASFIVWIVICITQNNLYPFYTRSNINIYIQYSILIVICKCRTILNILNMSLLASIDITIARYTR